MVAGERPLVIARGGFSGLFPESSSFANQMAQALSLPDMVAFCNLQLTKDGIGICLSDIRLDSSTNIALVYPKGQKTYDVNGKKVNGWFSVDYTIDQLFNNVSCKSQTLCIAPISWYDIACRFMQLQPWTQIFKELEALKARFISSQVTLFVCFLPFSDRFNSDPGYTVSTKFV